VTAYSFNARFIEPIILGTKRQTIRAERSGRSRHARPADTLQLYTGMRTKHCRLIGRAICVGISSISLTIHADGGEVILDNDAQRLVRTTCSTLETMDSLDAFAVSDGFVSWSDFCYFWENNHPQVRKTPTWKGVLIRWSAFKPEAAR
jgi:hypothetical protein